jgi:hypothetical protein
MKPRFDGCLLIEMKPDVNHRTMPVTRTDDDVTVGERMGLIELGAVRFSTVRFPAISRSFAVWILASLAVREWEHVAVTRLE